MKRISIVIAALLSCNGAIAQANTAPTAMPPVQTLEVTTTTPSTAPAADTKVKAAAPLPAITVTAPAKKNETTSAWSKCDLDCRMKVVASTLEKADCSQDMATGFKGKQAQAVILKIPTQDALVARVEEICKEDLDNADKTAEALKLEPTAPAPAAIETNTKPVPVREAGGYGRQQRGGRWSQEDDGKLEELLARKSQHVLQGIPTKFRHEGYVGRKTGPQAVPAGCSEHKVRKGNEMFVRVVCN